MPTQIWDMIMWCGILVVGISSVGFWVQRIINFLTIDIKDKETNEQAK